MSEGQYVIDILEQIHINSSIAKAKFANVKVSMICLFVALIPWAISVVKLYGGISLAINDIIEADVDSIAEEPWSKRESNSVPTTDSIKLFGGAVELDATFLYADLANSSKMAKEFDRRITARIIKSFLTVSTRLVKYQDGSVISFDGDRVLGVFVGERKNTTAAVCALNINYAVSELIRSRFEKKYVSVRNADFRISHAVGIDTGTVFIVRAGVRGSNDLISIGRAPNLAAKLVISGRVTIRHSSQEAFIPAFMNPPS